jgi:hypothetical protein
VVGFETVEIGFVERLGEELVDSFDRDLSRMKGEGWVKLAVEL